MNDTPTVPSGQPTWARVRHGAGCSLPHRLKDGTVGILPTTVPMRLTFDRVDERGEVWVVPVNTWSEGDSIELGPLPAGVRVEYEIARTFVAPFPAYVDEAVPA